MANLQKESNAVPLAYTLFDKTSASDHKEVIIIVHGMLSSRDSWKTIAEALSDKWKVLTVDCRNHGESPHVPDMNYGLMAADLELLTKNLNISKATFIGHSMGGKAVMALALNKPDIIDKLVVVDISPDVHGTAVEATKHISYMIQVLQGVSLDNTLDEPAMRESVDQQLMNKIPIPGMRAFLGSNLVKKENGYSWKINLDALSNHLAKLMAFPDSKLSFKGDTLFVGGSESDLISDRHMPLINRFFPAAIVRHIEGAGHVVNKDKPEELQQMICEFLTGKLRSK